MASGKTTVGRAVTERLSAAFIDLDERIETAAGRPIPAIFDQEGEPRFRDMEHEQLRTAIEQARRGSAVIALGGGAFAEPRNVAEIAASGGITVWLDAPVETLLARCAREAGTRPLARDTQRFRRLYRERLPFYERADLRIDASGPAADVVEQVLQGIR